MKFSIENRIFRRCIIAGVTLIISIIVYGIVCFFVKETILGAYDLTRTEYSNGSKYTALSEILNQGRSCDEKLRDIYLNNTSESQNVLKYNSCNLQFSADNRDNNSEKNYHYANLIVTFDIQDSGKFFFPISYLKNNKTISITQTIKLEEYQFNMDTKRKISNISNSSNYHNGDVITISANGINSKEYILKGVVNHIYSDSIGVDFEDASINYRDLNYDVNSLKKED